MPFITHFILIVLLSVGATLSAAPSWICKDQIIARQGRIDTMLCKANSLKRWACVLDVVRVCEDKSTENTRTITEEVFDGRCETQMYECLSKNEIGTLKSALSETESLLGINYSHGLKASFSWNCSTNLLEKSGQLDMQQCPEKNVGHFACLVKREKTCKEKRSKQIVRKQVIEFSGTCTHAVQDCM